MNWKRHCNKIGLLVAVVLLVQVLVGMLGVPASATEENDTETRQSISGEKSYSARRADRTPPQSDSNPDGDSGGSQSDSDSGPVGSDNSSSGSDDEAEAGSSSGSGSSGQQEDNEDTAGSEDGGNEDDASSGADDQDITGGDGAAGGHEDGGLGSGSVDGGSSSSEGNNANGEDGDSHQNGDEEEDQEQAGDYSKRKLVQLLKELAEAAGENQDDLIEWFTDDGIQEYFVTGTLEQIYDSLREDPLNAEAFFEATQELMEYLPKVNKEASEPEGGDVSDDVLKAAEIMQRRMDRLQEQRESEDEEAGNGIGRLRQKDGTLVSAIKDTLYQLKDTVIVYPNDAYINWIEKETIPTLHADNVDEEIYRHYTTSISFDLSLPEGDYTDADVVLLIDNSLSTSNALWAAQMAAVSFVKQPALQQSNSRVAVVSFSNEGELEIDLTDVTDDEGNPNEEIIAAIMGVQSNNLTNLQAGILEARRVFGLADGDTYNRNDNEGRSLALIILTDGDPNYRHTDIWRYRWDKEISSWYLDIDLQTGDDAEFGTKRWTSTEDPLARPPYITIDGTKIMSYGDNQNNLNYGREIARLEAQYLVGQGVNLYVVDYADIRGEFVEALTYRMETEPDFLVDDITEAPYEGQAVVRRGYQGERVFAGDDPYVMERLSDIILSGGDGTIPAITLAKTLAEEFEFVEDVMESLSILDEEGNDLTGQPGWDNITFEEGTLVFTTPADLAQGSYTLQYNIRVKDDEAQPLRYFPNGEVTAAAENTAISYKVGATTVSYKFEEEPEVYVPPLLWISGEDAAAFAGEEVPLKGQVNRGNGNYTYAWYDSDHNLLQEGPVPLDGVDETTGVGLQIPVPDYLATAGASGEYTFYLQVTDLIAFDTGYSGGRMEVPVLLEVIDGTLTVSLVSADGSDIEGQFEVTITRVGKGNDSDEQYHFMGLGTRVYDSALGLTRGTYVVTAYVPYGYRLTGDNKTQTVEFNPVQDEDGEWTGREATVTLELEKTNPGFFYDWAWWNK